MFIPRNFFKFLFSLPWLLEAHQRSFQNYGGDQRICDDITDGLSTLILCNVYHVQEAYRELARFYSTAHAMPFAVLSDGCNATRCLIETMENNSPLFC